MIGQEGTFISHAEFSLLTVNFEESPISPGTECSYSPFLFGLSADHLSFRVVQKPLGERVVNVIALLVLVVGFTRFWVAFLLVSSRFALYELPNVVVDYVVWLVRATWYFMQFWHVRLAYFMSVQEVLCFKVAQCYCVMQTMNLPRGIYICQRVIQYIYLLLCHFDYWTVRHWCASCQDWPWLKSQVRHRLKYILSERIFYFRCKTILVETIFLVNNWASFLFFTIPSFLTYLFLISLPLFLFWIANSHLE